MGRANGGAARSRRGRALRSCAYGSISAAIDLLAARLYQIYQRMVDPVLYSPTSFSLNFAQSSGTQSIRSVRPYFSARLVIWLTDLGACRGEKLVAVGAALFHRRPPSDPHGSSPWAEGPRQPGRRRADRFPWRDQARCLGGPPLRRSSPAWTRAPTTPPPPPAPRPI